MNLKVAAKIALFNEDKVLLVADPDGKWDFPGGGIEANEKLEEGLRRELNEELGLTQFELGPVVHTDEWFIASKELHVVAVFYRGTVDIAPDVALSGEHSELAWVAPADVRSYDVTPDTVRALEAMGL